MMPDEPRRFPPPWSVDEADSKLDRRSFIVRDATGQALVRRNKISLFDHLVGEQLHLI